MISETAPAKINLYLHVGPLRPDGLHQLASLFVFATKGDDITIEAASELSLTIEGPFADALADLPPTKNIMWDAAQALRNATGVRQGAAITLRKNLPIASGVGGGSADAAATLRGLISLWRPEISAAALSNLAFGLGADVPACLSAAPMYVTGAGENISKGPVLPPLWVCLVNPGIDMPTGPIFHAFDAAFPAPQTPEATAIDASDYETLKALLETTRNDLEPMARQQAPAIDAVIAFLTAQPQMLISRMSGSGATCFALFSRERAAADAARRARAEGWWAMASPLAMG